MIKLNNIKISVIVAAYNIDRYITRCLQSLICQTLKEIEIIVVNDGSSDRTELKIRDFEEMDSRIVLVNQNNQGSMEARKNGLNKAKGKYILFVDGDDWLEHNALEVLYTNAEKNNSDIVLYNAFKAYDDCKESFPTFDEKVDVYSLSEILIGKIEPNIWAKFIKLDYIRSNNIQFPSNISFAEDLATSCSLFIFNPKVSIEKTPLYNYYIRPTSITNTINSKVLEIDNAFVFIKRVLKYAQNEKVYSLALYQKYKRYNIDIYSNPYIKEKILSYPLGLRLRVQAYHHSYKLGQIYTRTRNLLKRGL